MKNPFLHSRKYLDLETKILMANDRIRQWYYWHHGSVYVSFSGGRDSTVLLDMVRKLFPNVVAVFSNTGLEYKSILKFINNFDNVEIIKPSISHQDVLKKYGYPIISKEQSQYIEEARNTKSIKLLNKRTGTGCGSISKKYRCLLDAPFKITAKCCHYLKKKPFAEYEKRTGTVPFIGTSVNDSRLRSLTIYKNGCNAFNLKRPQSRPLSFFTKQDILMYIDKNNLKCADIYNEGMENTGCSFCLYGIQREWHLPNSRLKILKRLEPKKYSYIMNELGFDMVLEYLKNVGIIEITLFDDI